MGKQTINNVNDFLRHEYPRYTALAKMNTYITSPELSDMPRGQARPDAMLSKMTAGAHAGMVVDAINNVMQSIPDELARKILRLFMDGHTGLEIEMLTGYSHSWVFNKRKEACQWFAVLFDKAYPDLLEPFVID